MSKDDEESSGCLIPILLFVVAVAAGGYCLHRFVGFDKIIDKFKPRQHKEVKIIDPSLLHREVKPEKPQPPPEVKTNEVVVAEEPEKPKRTIARLKAETDAAQDALDQEIAKARATENDTSLRMTAPGYPASTCSSSMTFSIRS